MTLMTLPRISSWLSPIFNISSGFYFKFTNDSQKFYEAPPEINLLRASHENDKEGLLSNILLP